MSARIVALFIPDRGSPFIREDVVADTVIDTHSEEDEYGTRTHYERTFEIIGGAPMSPEGETCEFYVRVLRQTLEKKIGWCLVCGKRADDPIHHAPDGGAR